jgi:hypothetical protein
MKNKKKIKKKTTIKRKEDNRLLMKCTGQCNIPHLPPAPI